MNLLALKIFTSIFSPQGIQAQHLQMHLASASLGPGNLSLFPNLDVPVDSIKQWLPSQQASKWMGFIKIIFKQNWINFIFTFSTEQISSLWLGHHSLPLGTSRIDISHHSALIFWMFFDFFSPNWWEFCCCFLFCLLVFFYMGSREFFLSIST